MDILSCDIGRRHFLSLAGAGLFAGSLAWGDDKTAPRKKLAVITMEWRYHSHAWHMAERFLVGYPINGRWHRPPFDVVSAYVDQFPESDLSRGRAEDLAAVPGDVVQLDRGLAPLGLAGGAAGHGEHHDAGCPPIGRRNLAETVMTRSSVRPSTLFSGKNPATL